MLLGVKTSQRYTISNVENQDLALNIRDCVSLCFSEETLNAVGPFYLVFMPEEVKYPTQGVNV